MSLTPINDHIQRALDALPQQFKNKVNWEKLINILIAPFQELEDVAQDLLTNRALDTAIGVQLDGIGQIVGLARNGMNDEQYRFALRFKIFINISSGEAETLIRALKYFTDANYIKYDPLYPAGFQMFTDGSVIPDNLIPTMQSIAMAGVSYIPVAASFGQIHFAFSDDVRYMDFLLNNGDLLLLDDGNPLLIFSDETDGFRELNTDGFAELSDEYFLLDNLDYLLLDDNAPLIIFADQEQNYVGGGKANELFTKDRLKASELALDNNDLFLLDSGEPLIIFYRVI